jgi:hypothetical protein
MYDIVAVYQAIQVPEEPPHVLNVSQSSVHLTWIALEQVVGYSVEINGVEMYRGMKNYTLIENLKPNMTYFMTVAGVTDWGTDGKNGPKGNFTTLP